MLTCITINNIKVYHEGAIVYFVVLWIIAGVGVLAGWECTSGNYWSMWLRHEW